MQDYDFKKGQIVYVLGRYKARVVECDPSNVLLDVYEGLSPNQRAPQRAGYGRGLVEACKRTGNEGETH